MNDLERQFLLACQSAQVDRGAPFEITSILNAMELDDQFLTDAELVDAIDAVMDSLFRRRLLVCPGHRWLANAPDSIRGHLVELHQSCNINRDADSSQWTFVDCTSYFCL